MIRYLLVGVLGIAVGVVAARTLGKSSPATPATAVTLSARDDSAAAIPGIAALHRADSVATIAGVATALRDLWDSAAVRIVPGAPATVTRAAIYKEDSTYRTNHPERNVVRYAPHYHAPWVNGNSAVEWGYFDATYVTTVGAKADTVSVRGNALRVLRRQSNGEWRFSHVILNSAR
jgi:hypothetical protein